MSDTPATLAAINELASKNATLAAEVQHLAFALEEKKVEDEHKEKVQKRRVAVALTACIILMVVGAMFLGMARDEAREARRERNRVTVALCDIANRAEEASYERNVVLLETIKVRVPDENVIAVVADLLAALPPPAIRTC